MRRLAVALVLSMWAGYSALSIIGVFHPLKMLPIVAFEILYTWKYFVQTCVLNRPRRRVALGAAA